MKNGETEPKNIRPTALSPNATASATEKLAEHWTQNPDAQFGIVKCRQLFANLNDRIREIMYDEGKLQRVSIEDPGTVEEFWKHINTLDEAMTAYIHGIGLWDATNGEPSVMDAARELYIYMALL